MRLSLATAICAFLSVPAGAATLHEYGGLVLSPAGDRIASVESDAVADSTKRAHGRIVVRSVADGRVLATIDPCPDCDYSNLAFAPDGRLAFIERAKGSTQLMLAGAGAPVKVATIDGIGKGPRFSPDGRRIALLVTIGARKEAGATQAGIRQVGEIGETNDEQRIAIVPASGGTITPVSPADRYIYEYDWTPDGSGFVVTSALGNGDNNWWIAELDRIDAATGAVHLIAAPKTQINQPRVSPDGRTVAFIGGIMSDFGSVGGDVYTVPITGGEPVDRTPGYRGTFTSLLWGRAGLEGTALIGDRNAIVPFNASLAPAQPLWSAPVSISAGDARFGRSADGRTVAFVSQDFEHPLAIFAGAARSPRQVTHDNDSWAPMVTARSLSWQSGPYTVQGWLLGPRTAKPGKAPMVTSVHGGPAAANTPNFVWQGGAADLIHEGYYIFLPNPRGSYGQGEAFTRANIRGHSRRNRRRGEGCADRR